MAKITTTSSLVKTVRKVAHGSHTANDRQHFDSRKPEFELAVKLDRQEVDGSDDHPENGNENGHGDAVVPVLNNEAGCGKFKTVGDSPRKPVNPAHGKTQTGVNESRSILAECTRNGNVRGHFGQTHHDGVDDGTDECISDEGTSWTGLRDGLSATNEQTCADGATCGERGLSNAEDGHKDQ